MARPDRQTPRDSVPQAVREWLESIDPIERKAVELAGAVVLGVEASNYEMLSHIVFEWDLTSALWMARSNPGSRYSMILQGCGNPDMRQFSDVAPTMTILTDDLSTIPKVARAYIAAFELGLGNWPPTLVVEPTASRAWSVAYNGELGDEAPHEPAAPVQRSEFLVDIDEPAPASRCECGGGCGWVGSFSQTTEIEEVILTPGHPSPAGRCPDCSSLAYSVETMTPAEACMVAGLRELRGQSSSSPSDVERIDEILRQAAALSGAVREAALLPIPVMPKRSNTSPRKSIRAGGP